MLRKSISKLLVVAAALLLGGVPAAFGYWSTTGGGSAAATTGTLGTPAFTSATGGAGTASFAWSAVAAPGSGAVKYYVTRDGDAVGGACGTVSAPITATTCTDAGAPVGSHDYRVIAVYRSWTATSDAVTVTVASAATLDHFDISPASGTKTAGTAFAVQVTARTATNATYTGYTGTVHFTSGDAAAVLPADTAFTAADQGTKAFNVTLKTAGSRTVTVADGAVTATGTYDVAPATATKLAFATQPSSAAAAQAITPAVKVELLDDFGNRATAGTPNVTVGLAANPGSGTLSGTKTVAASNGVATFADLSIDKAATGYKLSASANGTSGATSSSFDIAVGAASRLAFGQQPSTATSAQAITPAPTVRVLDAGGNLVTAGTTSVTVAIGTNPSSGTLSGTKTQSTANGVATFADLSIDKAGAGYTLTASANGLSGDTSSPFTVNPGVATTFSLSVPAPALFTAGTAVSGLTLTALDAQGNVATSYAGSHTIAWSAPASPNSTAATLPPSSISFTSGISGAFAITLTRAGANTVTFGETSGPSGSRSITVDSAGVRMAFTCPSGKQPKNQPISVPIVAPNDAYGNAFSRTTKPTFSLALSDSNFTFPSGTTFPMAFSASPTPLTINESGANKSATLSMTSVSAPFTAAADCALSVGN